MPQGMSELTDMPTSDGTLAQREPWVRLQTDADTDKTQKAAHRFTMTPQPGRTPISPALSLAFNDRSVGSVYTVFPCGEKTL